MTRYTLLAAVLLFVAGAACWSQEDSGRYDPFAEPDADPFGPAATMPLLKEERSVLPQPLDEVTRPSRHDTPVFVAELSSEQSAEILQKLSEPLTEAGLSFSETPLSEVVDFLRNEYAIEIQIDTQALDDLGLSPDDTISASLRNISLASALKLMLKQHDLTYIIADEVLLITSEDEALARLSVRVYPVGDLLQPKEGQPATSAASVDDLIDVVISTIASDTWAVNGGGEAEIRPLQPGMLIVSQTQAVHEEIANLLSALRRARQHELALPYTPAEKTPKPTPGQQQGGGAF